MGYIPKPPISTPQSINYVDYIAQSLDTSLAYSEYVSENLDNAKAYIDFLANLGGIQLKNPTKGMDVVPSSMEWMSEYADNHLMEKTEPNILLPTPLNEQINPNLGWWCQKNKTSNDFWKYKL